MCDALKNKNLVNMVNFSYRNSSGYQELVKTVQSGKIGNIIHMDANYYQSWLSSKYWGDWTTEDKWLWRLSTNHGSMGTLGDIGVHIFDFASFPIGTIKKLNARLKTFKSKGEKIKDYTLDANDTFISMVEFENGALGTITSTRFATGYSNRLELRIFGDKGAVKIEFDDALTEGNKFMFTDDIGREFSSKEDKLEWKTIETPPTMNNFEKFIDSIKNDVAHEPNFNRGAEIQNVLDKCAKSSDSDSWVDI
jgi:predicted dehydrogenase